MLLRIRGGSGLGDSIYIRPIIEHFVRLKQEVVAISNYPEIFIGSGASVEPFRRDRIEVIAHYTAGKADPDTTQWQDICNSAKVETPFAIKWKVRNPELISHIRQVANGRKVIVVHGGRAPMGRTDGFGLELLPERQAFISVLESMNECLLVSIGNNSGVKYEIPVELDLNGKTSVSDLMDIGKSCDGIVAQCSYAIPLAEAFDKPLLAVWSETGLDSNTAYIKTITPKKILSKPTSRFVMDSWGDEQIREVASAFP